MHHSRYNQMIKVLKAKGHRLTPQRLAILKILAASLNHPGIESIYETVKTQFPTISLATVYNTINLLKTLNEVLELGFAHMSNRYNGNKPYPHPHAVCTACGAIADPELGSLTPLLEEMAERTGFQLTHHQIYFFGLCPACRRPGLCSDTNKSDDPSEAGGEGGVGGGQGPQVPGPPPLKKVHHFR